MSSNSLPSGRRALLSERLEQATPSAKGYLTPDIKYNSSVHRIGKQLHLQHLLQVHQRLLKGVW